MARFTRPFQCLRNLPPVRVLLVLTALGKSLVAHFSLPLTPLPTLSFLASLVNAPLLVWSPFPHLGQPDGRNRGRLHR